MVSKVNKANLDFYTISGSSSSPWTMPIKLCCSRRTHSPNFHTEKFMPSYVAICAVSFEFDIALVVFYCVSSGPITCWEYGMKCDSI